MISKWQMTVTRWQRHWIWNGKMETLSASSDSLWFVLEKHTLLHNLPQVMETDAEMREWSSKLCFDNSIHVLYSTQTWGVTKSMQSSVDRCLLLNRSITASRVSWRPEKKTRNHYICQAYYMGIIVNLDNYDYYKL